MPRDVIRLEGVTKRFVAITAVSNFTWSLQRGEIHALVGENGAGKSTIVKMLSGAIQPDEGQIIVNGEPGVPSPAAAIKSGIATIFQDRALVQQLTVSQNIALGVERELGTILIGGRAQRERAERALKLVDLDIDPNAQVDRLSVGDQQLVAMAKALSRAASVLILDEPTAALTGYEAERLMRLLRGFRDRGIAILYISHRLGEVIALADRVTVMKDGVLQVTAPMADLTERAIMHHMVGRDLGDLFPELGAVAHDVVMEASGLSAADGSFEDVSFTLRSGEILGVAGLEGSGKEDLADALGGGRGLAEGSLSIRGRSLRTGSVGSALRAGVGYVPPDRRHQALFPNISVIESIALTSLKSFVRGGLISLRAVRRAARELSSRLGIVGDIGSTAFALSGGNQQKSVLARVLCAGPKVMVLAEPTAGVDVGAKVEIYGILKDLAGSGAGIVVVSSEMAELIGCCHRIIALRDGHVSAEFVSGAVTEDALLEAQLPIS